MNINLPGYHGADTTAVSLERIHQLSQEQSLALAEKLVKVNVELTISEGQLDYMGNVINLLV